jgi:two-component system cell cycle sensor histidine kinase/response regulator CckA
MDRDARLTRFFPTAVPPIDYHNVFDHAATGLIVVDASFRIVAANRALGVLLGVDPSELQGRPVTELIDPEDRAGHPLVLSLDTSAGSRPIRRRLRVRGGGVVDVEVTSSELPDGSFLCAVFVTAARFAAEQLRTSEARFRTVAENLNAGLAITDLSERAIYVNDYLCRRTGYTADELIGQNLSSVLLFPRDTALHAGRLRNRIAGHQEVYEVEHRRKDGSSFMGEVSASPLRDGEGRLIGTVGVVIDVTARHEWEREMAEREYRYRTLFEVTPLPACVYDAETFRFLAVNPAAVKHYGYTHDEFLSMSILDVRLPEDTERVRDMITNWRTRGVEPPTPRLSRHRKKDGTLIDVEITSHPLEYENRQARLVVVHDVTEQLEMRAMEHAIGAQLLQAQKMEAVGRLAGGVAHDFNNLLSVMLTAAVSLEEMLPGDSPLREEVRDIRDAAERGAGLTRQLLAFGRKETRAPALLDVNEVIANVERLFARALGTDVELVVRQAPRPLRTVADANQLEQVLMNLAFNARDAMPEGGSVVVSTGECELAPGDAERLGVKAGRYVTLEVADTGVGMDEATRARAFEPFFTTKGPARGTGLGLATVYGIVSDTAGAVHLDSAPGRGTRVAIYLPEHQSAPVAGVAQTTVVGRRVLLVEDEPRVRAQARRLLERCGYTVFDAADGAEAEREFDAHRGEVDVVVTDVVMPGVGGVELVSRLRGRDPAVPVVFVSGFTAEDRELPLNERTLFVPKPYSVASLCEAIEMAVAG